MIATRRRTAAAERRAERTGAPCLISTFDEPDARIVPRPPGGANTRRCAKGPAEPALAVCKRTMRGARGGGASCKSGSAIVLSNTASYGLTGVTVYAQDDPVASASGGGTCIDAGRTGEPAFP